MSKSLKIKDFCVVRADGQTFYSPNLDEAMRSSKLHEAKGRLTKEQAIARAEKNKATIMVYTHGGDKYSLSQWLDTQQESTKDHSKSDSTNPNPSPEMTKLSGNTSKQELTEKLQELKDAKESFTEEKSSLEAKMDALEKQIQEQQSKIDAIKEKGLEETLSDLVDELLADLDEATQERDGIKDMVQDITDKLSCVEEQMEEVEEELKIPEGQPKVVKLGEKREHPLFQELLARCRAVKEAQSVDQDGLYPMLVGPAGSGKTTASRLIAQHLFGDDWRDKYAMMSMNEESERSEGFGFISPIDKLYKSTDFRKMYEFGGVFLLDELDASNPNALTALNAAISSPMAAFPDKVVDRHPDFVLIAAANTFGNGADGLYVGRNPLDGATKDRFQTMYWDYDWDGVRASRPNHTAFVDIVESLSKAATKLAMEIIISPRAALFGPFLFAQGLSVKQVLDSLVFKGLDDNDIRTLCEKANVIVEQ
jgi:molecular chaperone GrpE (heat shock protein)